MYVGDSLCKINLLLCHHGSDGANRIAFNDYFEADASSIWNSI